MGSQDDDDFDAAFDAEFADLADDQQDDAGTARDAAGAEFAAEDEQPQESASQQAPSESQPWQQDRDSDSPSPHSPTSSGSPIDLDAEAERLWNEAQADDGYDPLADPGGPQEDADRGPQGAAGTSGGGRTRHASQNGNGVHWGERDHADGAPAKRRRVEDAAAAAAAPHSNGGDSAAAAGGCTHPSYWAGMCVQCGAPKPEDDPQAATAAAFARAAGLPDPSTSGRKLGGGGAGAPAQEPVTRIKHLHERGHLELTAAEAARLRREEVSRLLSSRKLVLVLDLDHTLVNSVRTSEVDAEDLPRLEAILKNEEGLGDRRSLYCLSDKNLWTKIRPGAFALLDSLKSRYEMHIYTNGDRFYAAEIRRLLDPGKTLFKSVIAACHSTQRGIKDLDVALADDSLVVLLDDTEQVWPRHGRNLLQVERYHFFPASRKQWGLSNAGPASQLLKSGTDESETQGQMAVCTRVLKDIHESFFSPGEMQPLDRRDVRFYLARRRQHILEGCVLVFSRCWPQADSPWDQPLWKLAESLGADCKTNFDTQTTTHVVTVAPADTDKAVRARAEGKHVVTPRWLEACLLRWERMPEARFPVALTKPPKAHKPKSQGAASDAAHMSQADRDRLELQRALQSAGGGM